jgi:hypothetical protein
MLEDETPTIDITFDKRHTCWFCGEISYKNISVRDEALQDINYEYKAVFFPVCEECFNLSKKITTFSIEDIQQSIKDKIVIKYSKYLAIGSKWTAEEIQHSDFTGIALSGFKESAWSMFEQIKERVNYTGWDVSIDGITLGNSGSLNIVTFDGVQYSNLSELLDYLVKIFYIDKVFLDQVIEIYGEENITQAVKYSRLTLDLNDTERKLALSDLRQSKKEKNTISNRKKSVVRFPINKEDICEFEINKNIIPTDAILWAMRNGIITLNDLDHNEGEMFEYFENNDISENKVFLYFNALEIYLDKRNHSPSWRSKSDPNLILWERVIRSVKGNYYYEENFQLIEDNSYLHDESEGEYSEESLDQLMILESIIGPKAIKSGKIINSSQMKEFILDAGFYDMLEYLLFFDSIYGHEYEELLPEDPFSQYKSWKTWPL